MFYTGVLLLNGNEIGPRTEFELVFVSSILVVAAVINAHIFGSLAVIIQELNKKSARFYEKLDTANTTMANLKLSIDLKKRVINYIIYTQSGFDKIDEMKSFKSMLSPSLNTEVVREIFSSVKPIFEDISENLMDYVLEKITTDSFPPEDEIIRQGEVADSMYFLSTGECVVMIKDRFKKMHQERILKPGDLFGELALIANNKRTATIKTLNYCNCALLSREDFQDFCIFFPEVLNRLKKRISTYNDRLRTFQKQMLRNVDFFERLPEETINELSLTLREQFYEKNALAFESGSQVEHIIFILHGELDLIVKMDNGEEVVIDTLFQGCNVGGYSAICESSYTFYARARSNISAYTLSRDSIEEFRKVLVDLDDELALFERYSEANGLPV